MKGLMKILVYLSFLMPYLLLSIIPIMVLTFIAGIFTSGIPNAQDVLPSLMVQYFLFCIIAIILMSIAIIIFKKMVGKKKAVEMDLKIFELHKRHTVHLDPRLDLIEEEEIVFGPTPCPIKGLRKKIHEIIVTNQRITIGIQSKHLNPNFKIRNIFFMPIIFGEVNAWHKDLEKIPMTKSRLGFPFQSNPYPQDSQIKEITYSNDEIGEFIEVNHFFKYSIVRIYHPQSKEIHKIFTSKLIRS